MARGPGRIPEARPDVVRWSGRPHRLLPQRVRRASTLAGRRHVFRPGGAVPVSAGACEQSGRHGPWIVARRLARRACSVDRLHPAIRGGSRRLRLRRRQLRRHRNVECGARPESRCGGRGGTSRVGHGESPVPGPLASWLRRRRGLGRPARARRAGATRHDAPGGTPGLATPRAAPGGHSRAHRLPSLPAGRHRRAGPVLRPAPRAAGARPDRPRHARRRRPLLSRRRACLRRRARGAAAAASGRGSAGMGERRGVSCRLWRCASGAGAVVHVRRLSGDGDARRTGRLARWPARVVLHLPACRTADCRRAAVLGDASWTPRDAGRHGRRERGCGRRAPGCPVRPGLDECHPLARRLQPGIGVLCAARLRAAFSGARRRLRSAGRLAPVRQAASGSRRPAIRTIPHSALSVATTRRECRRPRRRRPSAPRCGRPCGRWKSGARSRPRSCPRSAPGIA